MRTYLAGFSWAIPGTVSSEYFCRLLESLNKKQFKFGAHPRLVLVSRLHGYMVGAILSHKTKKKFTTLELANLRMLVNAYKDGEPEVDFNLFALNPVEADGKLHGTYMYYHHSLHTRSFNRFMKQRFREIQSHKLEQAIKKAAGDKRKIREAKRQHPRSMTAAEKVQEGDRDAWINSLRRISAIEYNATVSMPGGQVFNDLGPAILHKRERVSFRSTASPTTVKAWVRGIVHRFNLTRGKLEGINANDEKVSIPLSRPPGVYRMASYDDIVNDGFLNPQHISSCALLAEMVEFMMAEEGEFGYKPATGPKEKR